VLDEDDSVDAAIRQYVLSRGDQPSEVALLATGENGLDRMVRWWLTRSDTRDVTGLPREQETGEFVRGALHALARANPAAFMNFMPELLDGTRDTKVTTASVLADVDDPRVEDVLAHFLSDEDYLVRHHAVRSLRKLPGSRVDQLLRHAVDDPDLAVSREATTALRKRT
jgi:hypothetical protein